MAPDRIGFDRLIRLRWLDRAALLAAELRDAEVLHQAVLAQLAGELPGAKARLNTASILTRIWWRTPDEQIPLRDEALTQMRGCTPDERLLYHWGMCLLAYPLFRDVAATVGRLLRLQGVVRQAQVVSRISAAWGNRSTLDTAVPRIVRSFVDWGVLVVAEEKGAYLAGTQSTLSRREMTSWLLTAVRNTRPDDRPTGELLRTPELFAITSASLPGD